MEIKIANIMKTLAMVVVFLLWTILTPQMAFLWSTLIIWAVFKLDERILGGIAILFLVAITIILTFSKDIKAEQLSRYAVFLFCAVIFLYIFNFLFNRNNDKS